MQKILIDTNIIIDYLMEREPHYRSAEYIFDACQLGKLKGYIAAHSISNMFYILPKDFTVEERRELLKSICILFTVVGINIKEINAALDNKGFFDFEDCLQMECVKEVNVVV